jgi:PAS domain S-box-containing protein
MATEYMFEQAADPAFVLDPPEDRILAANRAACAMLGYTREELLATPISQVHPAEMPQLREFFAHAVRDGHGSTIKLTCRTKSGDFLPAEIALLMLVSGGRAYALALVQDRCEHRQRVPSD